jgi:hypothetical protein
MRELTKMAGQSRAMAPLPPEAPLRNYLSRKGWKKK